MISILVGIIMGLTVTHPHASSELLPLSAYAADPGGVVVAPRQHTPAGDSFEQRRVK
jgi:hypothetical protein